MSSIHFKDNKILFDANAIAFDPNCCCDIDYCNCSQDVLLTISGVTACGTNEISTCCSNGVPSVAGANGTYVLSENSPGSCTYRFDGSEIGCCKQDRPLGLDDRWNIFVVFITVTVHRAGTSTCDFSVNVQVSFTEYNDAACSEFHGFGHHEFFSFRIFNVPACAPFTCGVPIGSGTDTVYPRECSTLNQCRDMNHNVGPASAVLAIL